MDGACVHAFLTSGFSPSKIPLFSLLNSKVSAPVCDPHSDESTGVPASGLGGKGGVVRNSTLLVRMMLF